MIDSDFFYKQLTCNLRWKCSIVYLLLLLVIVSCHKNPTYPPLLVEANNLFKAGNYQQADSLLAVYDRESTSVTDESSIMFRKLLSLEEKFVSGQLVSSDIALADSLVRYFENEDSEANALALLFLAEAYTGLGDNPSALHSCIKSEGIAKQIGALQICAWSERKQGDLFFSQRMLDECLPHYRNYYNFSLAQHDTLRMAYAAERMGKVYTIESNVDSVLYYYNLCIQLANNLQFKDQIVPYAKASLADIYIQLEEYEKAAAIMTYDSLNDDNWAYWHWGNNNIDSAIYYFRKALLHDRLIAKTEALSALTDLEKQRGNILQALDDYQLLTKLEDSVKVYSQTEETRRVRAQYNYTKLKQERDDLADSSRRMLFSLAIVLFLGFVFFLLSILAWKTYKSRKEAELSKERLINQEHTFLLSVRKKQIEENKQRIALLEQQLFEAIQKNDVARTERIKSETQALMLRNQSIEAEQKHREVLQREFKKSPVYLKLLRHVHEKDFRLRENDWHLLGQEIDLAYDHFTDKLLSLSHLSQDELHISYLIKVGLKPSDIASLLCKTISAIGQRRKRLYKKLTGKEGSAQNFDDFIGQL